MEPGRSWLWSNPVRPARTHCPVAYLGANSLSDIMFSSRAPTNQSLPHQQDSLGQTIFHQPDSRPGKFQSPGPQKETIPQNYCPEGCKLSSTSPGLTTRTWLTHLQCPSPTCSGKREEKIATSSWSKAGSCPGTAATRTCERKARPYRRGLKGLVASWILRPRSSRERTQPSHLLSPSPLNLLSVNV